MDDNSLKYNSEGFLTSCSPDVKGAVIIKEGTIGIISNAFKDCINVTSIRIPKSVKKIETNAFSATCKSLNQIYFDGTLEDWLYLVNWETLLPNRYSLFINGSKVTDIVIPENISSIRKYAFYNSSITSIVLNLQLQTIGDSAFNKSQLGGIITIPEGVVTIGQYCFLSCKQLVKVNIPSTTILIGSGAFRYCDKLVEINVNPNNPKYCSIDGFLYNKEKTILISAPSGFVGTHIVPSTVTRINAHSFEFFVGSCTIDFSKCESIEIGESAFLSAKNLKILVREGEIDSFCCQGVQRDLIYENVDFSKVIIVETPIKQNDCK